MAKTKYNEDIQARADDYLQTYDSEGDVIPSIEGLSLRLGIARSTLYDWKSQDGHPISDTLELILAKQASLTLNKGLDTTFNATISKLVLANHGYHDKVDSSQNVTVEEVKSFNDMYGDTES